MSIVIVKVAPCPKFEYTCKSPPNAKQISFEIYKPSPLPDGLILRFSEFSLLKKGLNIFFYSSLDIPIPWSTTLIEI